MSILQKRRKRFFGRKWTPTTTMNHPEPLKVFLQHRIKTIISKEWWDFVVNVNNMNSDHASLLYSVANLCPSFQNFLRTRDKELNHILKKRPHIKPRIFSGSEKSGPISDRISNAEESSKKKSCSAELDQILSEMYPQERSIIKRNPRTFGPISKQKRMQNAKKYQASLQIPKDIPIEDNDTTPLSKLLRGDDPLRDSVPIEQPSCSSNKDSKAKSHKVEYTISNYDVNRNKLSLNMKKVKKIIKVKKKIMTYTDNNDKSRTKYLLESETPELKKDVIRKYRIKKCSVMLQRLSWKQIKELTSKGKTKCSSTSKSSEMSSKDSSASNKKLPNITISIKQANSKEPLVTVHQKDVMSNKAISIEPSSSHCNGKIHNSYKNLPPAFKEVGKSLPIIENGVNTIKKVAPVTEKTLPASINESSSNLPEKVPKLISTKDINSVQIKESNSTQKIRDVKQGIAAELKQHDNQKTVITSGPDQLAALKSVTIISKQNLTTNETKCDKVTSKLSPPHTSRDESSANCEEPPVKKVKVEKVASKENGVESSQGEKSKSPISETDNSSSETQSNVANKSNDNIIHTSISVSPAEKESENVNSSVSAKYRLSQKENVAISEKYKSQELTKELYYHGAIVPLGKKSSAYEKPSFDKSKHFLSLKEKKVKDSLTETNESSVTPLKEKNVQTLTSESRSESTTLNTVKTVEKNREALKPVDNPAVKYNKDDSENSETTSGKESDKSLDESQPNSLKSGNNSEVKSNQSSNIENVKENGADEEINCPPSSLSVSEETGNSEAKNDKEETTQSVQQSSDLDSISNKEKSYVEDDLDDTDKLIIDECISMEVEVNTSTSEEEKAKEEELEKNEGTTQDKNDETDKDDVIIVETPVETIEIDSDDDDDAPLKSVANIKIEKIISYDSPTDPTPSEKNSETNNEEPAGKRPRIELNVTKMEIDKQCKVCNVTFASHDEWLKHYDKEVPKCTPNLQVSWETPQMPIIQ